MNIRMVGYLKLCPNLDEAELICLNRRRIETIGIITMFGVCEDIDNFDLRKPPNM